MTRDIILPIFILLCCYWMLCSSLGMLAKHYNVKVNYTRKIGHFSMFILPSVIYLIFNITDLNEKIVIASCSNIFFFLSLLDHFRKKLKYLAFSFQAIDRPEDRPYTLGWIFSQTFFGFIILAAFSFAWNILNIPQTLMYITILTTTVGDGLAEPIGIKFGKHKYAVKGFFVKKNFYRSYEGSLTVFITALVTSLLFLKNFNITGSSILLLLFPIGMTLTEARSPHTWDTPFLFFIGNLIVTGVYLL